MSFLQPVLLLALPLIAMPVVIHLMNQRRYQTVPWAAMHFLRKAKRLNAGVTKLRYWLVMALRMAAVSAVIIGLSRPIASGWLGWLGTNKRPIFVLLDRSPSMELQDAQTRRSKRMTALERIDLMCQTRQFTGDRFLVTSGMDSPLRLEAGVPFANLDQAGATSQTTDILSLFEKTFQTIDQNQIGAADIWVCSDLQASDWKPSNSQWESIRQLAKKHPSVRLFGLTYPIRDDTNFAVVVENIRRNRKGQSLELQIDVRLRQNSGDIQSRTIPVAVHVGQTRQVVEVGIQGPDSLVSDVIIPLDGESIGAGYAELPADANPSDNSFHFSYSPPPKRIATVVAEDDSVADLLSLALSTPYSDDDELECLTLKPDQAAQVEWDRSSLVCWQGDFTQEPIAQQIKEYVNRGGTIVMFPPREQASVHLTSSPDKQSDQTNSGLGLQWLAWQDMPSVVRAATWRTDSDICRHTENGEALPINDLRLSKLIDMKSADSVPLIRLENGFHLLTRKSYGEGTILIFHSLPLDDYSNLAQDGICLYVMLQRAFHDYLSSPLTGVAFEAGVGTPEALQNWTAANEISRTVLPWERAIHAGAYQLDQRVIAINRSISEDTAELMAIDQLSSLLPTLPVKSVIDDPSSSGSLVNEIWKAFIILVVVFLLSEGILSMPSASSERAKPELLSGQGFSTAVTRGAA